MRSFPWSPRSPSEWYFCHSDATVDVPTVMCSGHPKFILPLEFVLIRVHCTGQDKLITRSPHHYSMKILSLLLLMVLGIESLAVHMQASMLLSYTCVSSLFVS